MSLLGGVGEQLNFLIDLNADSAIREAKRFGDTVQKETKRSEDSLSKFSRSAATFGVGATAFGGAILAGLGKAVAAYSEAEKQHLKLTTAVGNSDQAFTNNGKAIADAAQHLQTYTTVEGDAAEAGAAMLVQFGLTEDQITALLPLVGDLSRRMGVDMEQAAKVVGKAAAGEGAAGLKKMGIVLDETSYSADAFGATVNGLKGTVGGFAANEATTAAGKIEMLKNNLGDIVEGVGAGAADVLGAVVGPLADIAQQGGAAGDVLEKIGQAGAVIGAGSVLIGGLALAASTVAKLKTNLTDAEGGLNRMGKAAAAAGIVAGAIAVAQLASALEDATQNAIGFDTATKKFAAADTMQAKLKALSDQAGDTEGFVSDLWHVLKDGSTVDLGGVSVHIDSLHKAIEKLEQSDPAQALDEINAALKSLGKDTGDFQHDELTKWLREQKKALEENAKATDAAKQKKGELTASDEEATAKAQEWTDALKATNGALGLYELGAQDAAAATKGFADAAEALDTDEQVKSALDLGTALHGVGDTVKDLPKTFDAAKAAAGGYTEQQTKAINSVLSWGDAAKGQITTLIASGATTDEVRAKTATYRDGLAKVMTQAGLSKDQIAEYQRIMGLTDPQVETEIKLAGDAEARFKLQFMQGQLDQLDKGAQAEILALIDQGEYAKAERRLFELSQPRTVPVTVEIANQNAVNNVMWALGGKRSVPGGGAPVPAPVGVNPLAAGPVTAPVPVATVTINLPAGATTATTLSALRRYQRLGGDMSGLLDSVVAVR